MDPKCGPKHFRAHPGKTSKINKIFRSGGFGGRQAPAVGATAASRAGGARGGPSFQAAKRSSGASRGSRGRPQKVCPINSTNAKSYLSVRGGLSEDK